MSEGSEVYKKRPKEHLFRLIARRNENTPNFALLIGAGASRTSNVKCASDMIAEWQQQLYMQSKSAEPIEKWLESQRWNKDDEKYGILFEKVCDQPSQRRIYIEECIKKARPSWGYIYLANLICHNYFSVIFTPNFDDLLNEACFIYTGCKPLVCAHDSAVSGIRITSSRPKIIKLHGDFLFDNIKNTIKETDSLEKNMQLKFMQFSREYGLIVIGYGGNDKSIMDILDSMIKPSEQEQYFPNGIYWCIPKKATPSRKLDKLLQREKVFLIEIDGFDEFMAELNEFLGLNLPETISDPYKATTERLNTFISQEDFFDNSLIKKHIEHLSLKIKSVQKALGNNAVESRLIPYSLLLSSAYLAHKYTEVIEISEKALKQKPETSNVWEMIISACLSCEKPEKALEFLQVASSKWPNDDNFYRLKANAFQQQKKYKESIEITKERITRTASLSNNLSYVYTALSNYLLLDEDWDEALVSSEKAIELDPTNCNSIGNKCLALKKLGKTEDWKKILTEKIHDIPDHYTTACYYSILEDKENTLRFLKKAIEIDSAQKARSKFDPEFKIYENDKDFIELTSSKL